MNRLIYLMIIFLVSGCDLDEDPPSFPTELRGYYTIESGSPEIRIAWGDSFSDDVSEYHIYRAVGHGNSFDSLTSLSSYHNTFVDTAIIWQEYFGYKIRSKDQSTNIGTFSDSIFIEVYKPSGNWIIPNFDSTTFCIEPLSYALQSYFKLNSGDSLTNLGDTLGLLSFSTENNLDSSDWHSNGWMTFSYSTLEMRSDSSGLDTIQELNLPEYYEINLANPDSGLISFLSGNNKSIPLFHSLKNCNGDSLFP